jgi:hypothetical protein
MNYIYKVYPHIENNSKITHANKLKNIIDVNYYINMKTVEVLNIGVEAVYTYLVFKLM